MYRNLKPNKYNIIYFNATTMTSLGFIIVGIPAPLFESLGGGRGGVQIFLLERGDKPVNGGEGG